MPTTIVASNTLDARRDRIDLRDLPYRSPLVSLPPQYPSDPIIEKFLPAYCENQMILDQRKEGSCTGFGLAAVVNYLRWERLIYDGNEAGAKALQKVSARMFYQNARLYDEWKGEDYEGSSCRGAIKGFHKHGVCEETFWPTWVGRRKGTAKLNWETNANETPLGAYYRIATQSLVDMQAAIFETHAIYVSAGVHDGWDKIGTCQTIEEATIPDPTSSDRGGHAFALVGYTPTGFILQNSWGPKWGYKGFAILPYLDWSVNGYDAWALALGAPIKSVNSPSARTDISLETRMRARSPLMLSAVARDKKGKITPWVDGQEASHLVVVGHNGRADRELVGAEDAAAGIRFVVQNAVAQAAAGKNKIAIIAHGGLNGRSEGIKRAQVMGPWFLENGIQPIFIVWQTGFLECASDMFKIAMEKLGVAPERVEGWVTDAFKEAKNRAFETFARDFGVRAIWENMKFRAEKSADTQGAMALVAAELKKALKSASKRPDIHLIGHSAGAILHGHFLDALANKKLKAASLQLWAPACTVDFANKKYGTAFKGGVLDRSAAFFEVLSDKNETSDPCVPVLYSCSLLYLICRALEPEHKTPVLGLEKVWTAPADGDDTFDPAFHKDITTWLKVSKGVQKEASISTTEVPTREVGGEDEKIRANHGSFDNNLVVVNRALSRILGADPNPRVTDLRGF